MEAFDSTLHTPFNMVISGPTQAGKSELTKEVIRRRSEIMNPPVKHVVYCYGTSSIIFKEKIDAELPDVTMHKGLPESLGDEIGTPYLYIFDDLMQEVSNGKSKCDKMFTRGSHHNNCSIIFITQNFYYDNLRTITTNLKYLVLFKNPSETQKICKVGMI